MIETINCTKLCACPGWPAERFGSVPSPERAIEIARYVQPIGVRPDHPFDAEYLANLLGIKVKRTAFETGTNLEALLIPMSATHDHSFTIVVGSTPGKRLEPLFAALPTAQQTLAQALLTEVLIGHELGHTFFYNWQPYQHRTHTITSRLPRSFLSSNQTEEVWCDTFAYHLLLVGLPARHHTLLDKLVWTDRRRTTEASYAPA